MSDTDVIIGGKIKKLREGIKLSQSKMAEMFGGIQTSLYRYETGATVIPHKILLWYADYFDVSLDYLYGRCDNPQGKLYNFEPQAIKEKFKSNKQMQEFVEMCFDPNSLLNDKLKQTLVKMLDNTDNK